MIALLTALALAADPAPLSLAQAMDMGAHRPAAEAAQHRARAARAAAATTWAATAGPVLAFEARATRSEKVDFNTPIGAFPQVLARNATAGGALIVPLFDPAGLFVHGPAADRDARAARLGAERTRQELAAEAAGAWLDLLELQARLGAARAYRDALVEQLEVAQARERSGAGLSADTLRIGVSLADAEQDVFALVQGHDVAQWSLGRAVGLDGPALAGELPALSTSDLEEDRALARQSRADLASLRSSLAAETRRRDGVWAEALPTLAVRGGLTWTDQQGLSKDHWVDVGLVATWTPIAGGTRATRTTAHAATSHALAAQVRETERAIDLQVRAAHAQLAVAHRAIAARDLALEQATEARRMVHERYAEGAASLTDTLLLEAQVRNQATLARVARVEAVRRSVEVDLAVGK